MRSRGVVALQTLALACTTTTPRGVVTVEASVSDEPKPSAAPAVPDCAALGDGERVPLVLASGYAPSDAADLDRDCALRTGSDCALEAPRPDTRVLYQQHYVALRGHGQRWYWILVASEFDDVYSGTDLEIEPVALAPGVVGYQLGAWIGIGLSGYAELGWCVVDERERLRCSAKLERWTWVFVEDEQGERRRVSASEVTYEYPGDGTIVARRVEDGQAGVVTTTRYCLDFPSEGSVSE